MRALNCSLTYWSVNILLFIAFGLVGNAAGLFPDQAGVDDWHLRHVGTPLETIFYKLPQTEDETSDYHKLGLIPIVRTEKNYIAALKPTDGGIIWRRSPNSNETVLKMDSDGEVVWVITKLGLHHYVRLYHPIKGHILWEFRLAITEVIPSIKTCAGHIDTSAENLEKTGTKVVWIYGEQRGLRYISTRNLITLSGSRLVVKYKVGTSKPVWAWEPKESPVVLSEIFTTERGVYVAGIESQSLKVAVYHLNVTDGSVLEQTVFDSAPSNPSLQFHLGRINSYQSVIWGEISCHESYASLDSLSALSFSGASMNEVTQLQTKLEGIRIDELKFIAGENGDSLHLHALLEGSVSHSLSFLLDDLAISSSQKLEGGILGWFQNDAKIHYLSLGLPKESDDQDIIQVIGQKRKIQTTFGLNRNRFGKITSVNLFSAIKNEFTFMVTTEDLSMHLFTGSVEAPNHAWTREESLAYVNQSVVLELPDSHLWTQADEPALNGLVAQYLNRIQNNFAALSSLLTSSRLPSQKATEGVRVRDRLGIRKLLVFATPFGKIMALDSLEKGTVVWSRFIGRPIIKLATLRSALVKLPPVLGIVTHRKSPIAPNGETSLLRIDGFTGLDFNSLPFDEPILGPCPQIMLLPVIDPSESTHVVAFISGQSVTLAPFFPGVYADINHLPQQIFGFFSNTSYTGGFHLSAQSDKVVAQPIWQFGVPAHEIVAVVTPTFRHSASRGRVLNDRRVLYKYLNPHLILVASYNHGLTISLIDAVSGTILHRATHPNAHKDQFQAVVTENTVIYHYWESSDFKGYITVVLELFESQFPDVRSEFNQTFSPALPYVSSRAFVAESMVSSLGVTVTRQGIASREFLFALSPANHIVAIPSRILDALRPYPNMPRFDTPESIMEYAPTLQLDPKAVLSYGQDVAGIAYLISSPTTYESTTIVFGYGLDIFWTSYAPSQQFDVLNPDFSKLALLFTVLALVIGILIAGPMLKEKKLREQWL